MSEYFVSISGVTGNATKTGYADQIQCSSLKHGIDMPVLVKANSADTGHSDRTAGYSMHGPIRLLHEIGRASPKLREKAGLNTNLGKVVIKRVKNNTLVETIELGNARVETVEMRTPLGANGSPMSKPVEEFGLWYEEIVWTNNVASITGGYDAGSQTTISSIPTATTG